MKVTLACVGIIKWANVYVVGIQKGRKRKHEIVIPLNISGMLPQIWTRKWNSDRESPHLHPKNLQIR